MSMCGPGCCPGSGDGMPPIAPVWTGGVKGAVAGTIAVGVQWSPCVLEAAL